MIPTTPRSPRCAQGGTASTSWCPRQNYVPIWIEEGLLLERPSPTQMENFKNVAPEWVDSDCDPGRQYSVPWQWGTIGVVVNTDSLQGRHRHLAIIFDPPAELKGKVNVVPEMNDVHACARSAISAASAAPATRRC